MPSTEATTLSIAEAFRVEDYASVLALVGSLPLPHSERIRFVHLQSLVELKRYQETIDLFWSIDSPTVDEKCTYAWALHKSGDATEADKAISTTLRDHSDRARPYWIAALMLWGDEPEYLLKEEKKKQIRDLLKKAMSMSDCWPGIYREYEGLLGYDDASRAEALEVRHQAHVRWPGDVVLRAQYGELVFATDPEAGTTILAPVLDAPRTDDATAELIARSCHIGLAVSDERYADALEHLRALVPSVASTDAVYMAQLALLAGEETLAAELLESISEPDDESAKIRYFYSKAALALHQGSVGVALQYCRRAHLYIDRDDPLDRSYPARLESSTAVRFLDRVDALIVDTIYRALITRETPDMADVLAYLECQLCAFSEQGSEINWALKADARLPIEYVKRTLFYRCLTSGEHEEALHHGLGAFLAAFEKGKPLENVYLYSESPDGKDLSEGFRPEHFVSLLPQVKALFRQKRKQPVRAFYRQHLRDWLIGADAYEVMLQILRPLIGSQPRDASISDLFDYALAYQRSGNNAEAEKYYRVAISKKNAGKGVFFNLSVILEARGDIDAAVNILERARPFEDEKYTSRYNQLCQIRDRRQDLRRFSIVYNSDKPPASVDPSVLSFRDSLYVLACIYALQSSSREDLVPETNTGTKISPHSILTGDILSHLADRGMIFIDPSTPRESYRIEEKELNYCPARVKWRLNVMDPNLSVRQLIPYLENACRERAKTSPDEVEAARQTLALWEALGYLQLRMDVYGYPYSITDKAITTFREITSHFSIAKTWNIIFQSLESAAAKQLENRLTRPHSANLAVTYCRSRANRAVEEGWKLKPYDRPREFPESAITHAWCYITNINPIDFLNHRSLTEKAAAAG